MVWLKYSVNFAQAVPVLLVQAEAVLRVSQDCWEESGQKPKAVWA